MKVLDKVKNLPTKVKKQLQTALLLLCAITTFAVPAFGGGYNICKICFHFKYYSNCGK